MEQTETKLYKKLRVRMYERGVTQRDVAEAIGKNHACISWRLSGRTQWRLPEMVAVMKYLDIDNDRMYEFFPLDGR
jgi:cyanate lyase